MGNALPSIVLSGQNCSNCARSITVGSNICSDNRFSRKVCSWANDLFMWRPLRIKVQ